jgi:hypothetical protein
MSFRLLLFILFVFVVDRVFIFVTVHIFCLCIFPCLCPCFLYVSLAMSWVLTSSLFHQLNLSTNGIHGTIPESIGKLLGLCMVLSLSRLDFILSRLLSCLD